MQIRNITKGSDWKKLAKRPELTHIDGKVYEASDEIVEVLLSDEPEAWEVVGDEKDEVPQTDPSDVDPVVDLDEDEDDDEEEEE